MKIFSILIIIIFTFILNIGLYYTSEDYRSFLRNVKEDNIVKDINDDYKIEVEDKDKKIDINKIFEESLNDQFSTKKVDVSKGKNTNIQKVEFVQKEDESIIKESDYFLNFLKKFEKFNLTKVESHSNLMGVTSEYPDKYFEYSYGNLTIYSFPTKNYKEVKEIFDIESSSNFFKLNELDNFGDESFYINFIKGYEDDFVRIIFSENDNVIGIKVSKKEYINIKNIIK